MGIFDNRKRNIKNWADRNKVIKYYTLSFLEDFVKFSPLETKVALSRFLGHGEGYINKKMQDARKNPTLLYGIDLISDWKEKLENAGYFNQKLEEIFVRYLENSLPLSNRMQIFKTDPKIKLNYFKNIDSLEKSYWLGWLFAEGSVVVSYRNSNQFYYFGVEINVKDMILIKRFINAIQMNPYKVTVYKRRRYDRVSYLVRIIFSNELFVRNLVTKGFPIASRHNEKKSGVIRMPRFENQNYATAFLLGFYDGDGSLTAGNRFRPRIASKSKYFINDIKDYFDIDYAVETIEYKKNDGRITRSYKLELERNLFNQMMDLEIESLERKKWYF